MRSLLGSRRADWHVPLLVLPAVAVLSGVTLAQDREMWATDRGWAWSLWASQTQIIGPILGAAAAWLTAEQFRGARQLWLGTMTRRRIAGLVAPWWCLVAGGLVMVCSAAVVVARVGISTPDDRWVWASTGSAVSTVVTCIALGTLTGRLVQHRVAPGLVAVGLWAMAVANVPFIGDWTGLDGTSMDLAGYRPDTSLVWHRTIAAVAIVIVAIYALSPATPNKRFNVPAIAVGLTGALVVALAASGWFVDAQDVHSDPRARASSCTGTAVRVCVMPEHQSHLVALQVAFARMTSAEQQIGLDPPKVFRETTPHEFYARLGAGWDISSRATAFSVDVYGNRAVEAVLSTVSPPECQTSFSSAAVAERWSRTQEVVVYWLGRSVAGRPSFHSPLTDTFDAMSTRQQSHWLRAAIPAVRACTAVPLDPSV